MPQLSVRVRGACGPWGPCGPLAVGPPVALRAFTANPFSSSGSVPFAAVFPMLSGQRVAPPPTSRPFSSVPLSAPPARSLSVRPGHATRGYCTVRSPDSGNGPVARHTASQSVPSGRACHPDPPTCADTTWALRRRLARRHRRPPESAARGCPAARRAAGAGRGRTGADPTRPYRQLCDPVICCPSGRCETEDRLIVISRDQYVVQSAVAGSYTKKLYLGMNINKIFSHFTL